MYYAYILFSQTLQRYYVGQCQDIQERLRRHNAGETKSNKNGIPWLIIWKRECSSRSEAMLLEKKIKSRGAKRFLSDIGLA